MEFSKRTYSFLKSLLIILAISFLAIYFRTYSIHGGIAWLFRSTESEARRIVDQGLKTQLQDALKKSYPQLSDTARMQMAALQFEKVKINEHIQYENAVAKAKSNLDQTRRAGKRTYLLEADPYHYFYLTEQLLKTGHVSDTVRAGLSFQPLMRAPHGHWEPFLLHPYVGLFWYRLFKIGNPQILLLEAVASVPLLLTFLVILVAFLLGKILRFSVAARTAGIMTLVLSPIFIQRSAFGWYDTDPYNYIFPMLILASMFYGFHNEKKLLVGVGLASFFTGFYALFWEGWAFMFVLVPASLLGSFFLLALIYRFQMPVIVKTILRFWGLYVLCSLVFLALFLTPTGFAYSIQNGWKALHEFGLSNMDIWPNIFLTVGEAEGITLNKLIFLTGNYVTFAVALVGVFLEGLRVFRQKDVFNQLRFVFFILFSIPLLLMSLKTERFSLLFVLPLSIFVAFAMMRISEISEAFMQRRKASELTKRMLGRLGVTFLFFLVFSPLLLLMAHLVAGAIRPIMDDVWYESLLEVRAKTPENAIVNSWWPPGYFIAAIANRRVTMDGGTQRFHEPFWMAKVLLSENEHEAAGILRMLNVSGDDALEQLQKWGMDVPDAVDLILKITGLPRGEALLALPSFMSDEQKNALLDKTHGGGIMPPSYLFLYDDLVTQNLGVSVLAQWDFRKAKKIQEQKQNRSVQSLVHLGINASESYVRDLVKVTGQWLRYSPVSLLEQRQKDVLYFKNGLRLDWATKEAFLFIPSQRIQGKPASLFYFDQGQLVEKKYEGTTLEISALVFEENGSFYNVLADAKLIRSLLFRLYYLRGQGLSLFKPLVSKGTLSGGTVVRVFELDRSKLSA
ncbi:MAG TPA: STT3 domain-containing protein [Candidatus Omnitrophota bacterium]|nr:STT3 domain-containing protein [Candidatus Omnitrophota bacterium]